LFDYSPELKLAYTFREELTAIFEMQLTREQAKRRLMKWLDKTANYFVDCLSSGFVEGLNNKVKTIKRRCYGIPRVTTLFQRLYLDLEGYRRFA
jgi:transposase